MTAATSGTPTLETALGELVEKHFDKRNDWYAWRRLNLQRLPPGVTVNRAGNQYQQTVEMKRELHRIWKKDPGRHEELANYIVVTWGGIKGNNQETIAGYARRAESELIGLGKTGIASWSKVLCIRDPNSYAIYDARVAVALNSLQVAAKVRQPKLFPMLASQNRAHMPEAVAAISSCAAESRWPQHADATFYNTYLELLRGAAAASRSKSGVTIMTVEMLLFSQFAELARQAFAQQAGHIGG
jgi:hypothetical protein